MCGIVGYVGNRPVVDVLIKGLKRLEYRGYDSAGVAFFRDGKFEIKKSEGKLQNVEKLLNGSAKLYEDARYGVGHTRWATHGRPTTQNAHPHRTGHVVIVANGIIENYQEIRQELLARGHHPKSETDSELFGFLVLEHMDKGKSLAEAVRESFKRVQGACSVVVMSDNEPGTVVGVRNGSPLVAAQDPTGGVILASDAQPLLEYTRDVYFLDHGQMAVGTEKSLSFFDVESGNGLQLKSTYLDWSAEKMDKGGYAHYMLKEIYEQTTAFADTLNSIVDRSNGDSFQLAAQPGVELLEKARELSLIACGSSWHASLLGKYWLENWARLPANVELASEFRYRDPVLKEGAVIVGISQSGETADTLAVISEMKRRQVPTIGVTNVRGSQISREAMASFYTAAGPETSVAATKSFYTQLLVFLLWAGYLGIRRNPEMSYKIAALFNDVVCLPHVIEEALRPEGEIVLSIKKAAKDFHAAKGFFFIGRGYSYPLALEAALKLKEIAYVHAEGYAAGELKHGPIAMIDENMVVVVIAPRDRWRDKTVSNLEEVKARGAKILGIGDASDKSLRSLCDHWVPLPETAVGKPGALNETLVPFLVAPAIQLLSYEIAVLRGTDIDKPRNLAKSVTVE